MAGLGRLGPQEEASLLEAVNDEVLTALVNDALKYTKTHCLNALTLDQIRRSGIHDVMELPTTLYGVKGELEVLLEKRPLLKGQEGTAMLGKIYAFAADYRERNEGQKLNAQRLDVLQSESRALVEYRHMEDQMAAMMEMMRAISKERPAVKDGARKKQEEDE
jgi:hypothetical protein